MEVIQGIMKDFRTVRAKDEPIILLLTAQPVVAFAGVQVRNTGVRYRSTRNVSRSSNSYREDEGNLELPFGYKNGRHCRTLG